MRDKKLFKKIIPIFIIFAMIFTNIPVYANNINSAEKETLESNDEGVKLQANPNLTNEEEILIPEEGVNIALNKKATASSTETKDYPASKAVDGNSDRNAPKPQSRWASDVSSDIQWLEVDLGKKTQFKNIKIEWERRNATNYRIQVSDDGTKWSDVYIATSVPKDVTEIINLESRVSARYVKLNIDKHISNSDGVNWNNLSIYEFELYNNDILEAPQTVEEVANSLKINDLAMNDKKLPMPIVPNGYEISFIGADYEEVIDYDMNIHRPLINTKVSVSFEVKKDGNKVVSPEIEITVPGSNEVSGNEKPRVIPELREWAGREGNFEITNNSRIVINKDSESKIRESMEIFAKDYKDTMGKEIEVVVSNSPKKGDFYFSLTDNYPELRNEGYYMEIGDFVKVESNEVAAAFLSTRTILQILKQNKAFIPKGLVRDYPKYDVRGFMLDVGRKFVSLEYVYEIMKTMSWYKMNDFQLHLNDNYIWLERDYGKDAIEKAYSGFRLESNDKGENGHNLTSTDGYYTKEEFSKFIDDSKAYGVNIVPEIDSPGHALAFVKAHPNYAYGNGEGENAAMLDVSKPEVVNYIKGIFSEYMDGQNPVFRDSVVHIGTDEFYGNSELYRKYTDEMLKFIRDEKKSTPRLWGSLTHKQGSTPVTADGVQMNIWNVGWANPKTMYDLGYDLINTDDAYGYIVPGASYYSNYLNTQSLYNNWEANKFSNGTIIPAGSKKMLGGMFAVWNDMIDKSANGIVEYDIFDRTYPAIQVLSEKMWSKSENKTYGDFRKVADIVGLAPNTNPRYRVNSKSSTVLDYDFKNVNNNIVKDKSGNYYDSIEINKATIKNNILNLSGESSYLKTPIKNLGPNYSVSFTIKRDESSNGEEQILFESPQGTFKAVQKESGKLGFSREGYDYSFNYELPKNEWVDISIVGKMNKTELYVNGEYVDEISKGSSANNFGTFVFPLEKIGSDTKSFKGEIKKLLVNNEAIMYDETKIPQSQMTAVASSEHPNIGTEGLASFAIDGDESTIWHNNWSTPNPLPQYITLSLGGSYTLDRVTYLPRQGGVQNGIATKYEIQASSNGIDFVKVSEGTFEANSNLKTVKFENPVEASHIRFIVKEGVGGFASAAEINVFKVKEQEPVHEKPDKSKLESLINKSKEIDLLKYTDESVKALKTALDLAVEVLNNEDSTEENINNTMSNLEVAINKLEEKTFEDNTGNNGNNNGNNNENSNENNNENNPSNDDNLSSNNSSITDSPNSTIEKSLPKTGGVFSTFHIVSLGVLIVIAGIVIFKKKKAVN